MVMAARRADVQLGGELWCGQNVAAASALFEKASAD
jgi:hypothetical protein